MKRKVLIFTLLANNPYTCSLDPTLFLPEEESKKRKALESSEGSVERGNVLDTVFRRLTKDTGYSLILKT